MTWDQQKKKRKGQGPPDGGSGLDLKDMTDQIPDTSKTKSKIEEALKKDAESRKRREKERHKTFFDQEASGCCI